MLWLFKRNRKIYPKASRRDRGFTLIELLVVMIIVGVLSAIVAPGFLGFVNNNRLSSSQSRVFSTLKEAQSTAKRSSTPTIFIIGNNASNGAYVQTSRSQLQYLEQGIQVLSITQGSTSLPVLTSSPPVQIGFNAQGLPTKADGSPFDNSDYPIKIILNIKSSLVTSNTKRCTTIVTLLGSTKTGSDTDCN